MRFLLLFSLALPLFSQEEVILDLATKTVTKSPARVEPPVQLKITVQNVNDFLYSYRGSIKVDPTPDATLDSSVFGFLSSKVSGCDSVDADAKSLKDGLDTNFRLKKANGSYPRVTLDVSQKKWNDISTAYLRLEAVTGDLKTCASWIEYVKSDQTLAKGLDNTNKTSRHEYTFTATLSANGTVTVTIKEFYNQELTNDGSTDFTFSTSSNQFFLSVGFLATEVQARAYDVVDVGVVKGTDAVPATDGQPAKPAVPDKTLKQLRIQGTGKFRPAGMVLLNYKIPWKPLLGPNFGAALSAGMVYRAAPSGGNSTTTSFGVFAGGSIHLWERFWVTPGVHIGEFSDLPKGFSTANGLTVPDGYPSSFSGTNRWTTRFAVGITFRAADFKAATSLIATPAPASGSSKNSGAAGTANQAPAAAATPAAGTGTTSSDPLVASITKLKADLKKAQDDLTTATTAQSAAQAVFDSATKAVADAQKLVNDKTADTATKTSAKTTADAAVTTAAAKLSGATAADQPALLKALQDATTAASDAAVALGTARAEQASAETALQSRKNELIAAGTKLSTATATTATAQQAVSKLQATQQAACAAIGGCK